MENMLTLHEVMIGIIVVLVLVLIFTIGLLFYGFRRYQIVVNQYRWKEHIDTYLMQVIVDGAEVELYVDATLARFMGSTGFRRFFLSQLIESERKFAGAAVLVLHRVFHAYHLEKEAYILLRSHKPYLIARGIQALTVMGVEGALPEISSMQTHKDPKVYHEVQYALVYFKDFDGLYFLDNLNTLLSDWQQLRIINSIKTLSNDACPSIARWLTNGNPSVVLFALKLIRKFRLFELHENLFNKLHDLDERVQGEVVKTLFSIETAGTSDKLISFFNEASEIQRLEIIKGLGYTRALDQVSFLKQQLLYYPTEQGKIYIAEALSALGEMAYLFQLREQLESGDRTLMVLNHALQNKL